MGVTYRQDPPYTIKVELTEGCNLYCKMCGLQGIRERPGGPYKHLTLENAEHIAHLIAGTGWSSKIEYTLRGEPLMNPEAPEIVRIFRQYLPRTHLMVTTNGLPLLRKPGVHGNLDRLFDAGLNILAMDCYEASKKAEAQVRTYARPDVEISDYPGPRSPYHKVPAGKKYIILMEDFEKVALSIGSMGTKHVNNHLGAGSPPLSEPMDKRCARPFRELVIRWDGRIALCCNSWRDEYQCGRITDYRNLEEAWNNKYLMAARRKLYQADRDFGVCKGCNEVTYRNGLLPDRLGKENLRKPNAADEQAIEEAMSKGPATKPVLRPWEKEKDNVTS